MYLCKTLDDSQKCIEWVIYEQPDFFASLAITKGDMVAIGGSLGAVFALFAAFAIIAKAAKMA